MNSLLSIDYSQLELRVAAHLSGDPLMIEAFINGEDLHSKTSVLMFGNADKDNRYKAKTVSFRILYGGGAHGLLKQFENDGVEGWDVAKCEKLIRDYFSTYQVLERWILTTHETAIRTGMVQDMFGRIRYIPEVRSVHPRIRAAGLRQAGNFPVQSTASQIIKEAMVQLQPLVKEFHSPPEYICLPLLQIHDELLFEVSDNQLHTVAELFRGVMEECVRLDVPVVCDVSTAKNWGEIE